MPRTVSPRLPYHEAALHEIRCSDFIYLNDLFIYLMCIPMRKSDVDERPAESSPGESPIRNVLPHNRELGFTVITDPGN